jgi:opacity protein-like surface antigen
MKRLFAAALLVLTMGCATRAQVESESSPNSGGIDTVPADSSTGAALGSGHYGLTFLDTASRPLFAIARVPATFGGRSADSSWSKPAIYAALPDPSPAAPEPRFVFGGRDDFRWQMGLGISIVRFRSSQFYATGVGTNTSITYFTNDWFGVEGRVTTSFTPTVYLNGHVKFVGYGAGPKLAWRQRKFEPFVHAIFGGVHILPQSALGSANGFEVQLGGGVGYRFNPRLSTRVIVDWVPTRLWGQWQDNAQAALEAVLHF